MLILADIGWPILSDIPTYMHLHQAVGVYFSTTLTEPTEFKVV